MQLKRFYIFIIVLSLLISQDIVQEENTKPPKEKKKWFLFKKKDKANDDDITGGENQEEVDNNLEDAPSEDSKEIKKQKKKEEKQKKKEERKKKKEERKNKKKNKSKDIKEESTDNSNTNETSSDLEDTNEEEKEKESKTESSNEEKTRTPSNNAEEILIDSDNSNNIEDQLLQAIIDQNKKIDLLIEHLDPSRPNSTDLDKSDDSVDMLELLQIVQNKFYDIDETISGSDVLFKSITDEMKKLDQKIESINVRLETQIQSLEMSQSIFQNELNSKVDSLETNFSSGGTSIKELEDLNKDLILKMLRIDDKYNSEITRLEKKISDLENSISTLKEISKDLVVSVLTQPQKKNYDSVSNTKTNSTGISRDEYKKKYDNAYLAYLDASYKKSLSIFQELLDIQDVNDLTDNCQYWVGEIYYSLKDYSQAIDAFNKVFTYTENNKGAYAQYKLGLCYLNINDTNKAIDAFTKVVNNYNSQADLVEKSEQFIKKYNK